MPLYLGISTFFIFAFEAASILSSTPPTGPIIPPVFMVPVIVVDLLIGRSSKTATVRIVIAALALGPPMIGLFALIV